MNNEVTKMNFEVTKMIFDEDAMDFNDLIKIITCNKNLTNLKCKFNHLNSRKIRDFLDALNANTSITHLDLSGNNIGNNIDCLGIAYLLKKNKNISNINLSHNKICDRGCQYILDALNKNTSLLRLNLDSNNNIEYKTRKLIETGLQENRILWYLSFNDIEKKRTIVRTLLELHVTWTTGLLQKKIEKKVLALRLEQKLRDLNPKLPKLEENLRALKTKFQDAEYFSELQYIKRDLQDIDKDLQDIEKELQDIEKELQDIEQTPPKLAQEFQTLFQTCMNNKKVLLDRKEKLPELRQEFHKLLDFTKAFLKGDQKSESIILQDIVDQKLQGIVKQKLLDLTKELQKFMNLKTALLDAKKELKGLKGLLVTISELTSVSLSAQLKENIANKGKRSRVVQ